MDQETTLAPLSSEKARELLLDQIARSVKAGATVVSGGKKLERDGFYMEPAILADVRPGNWCARVHGFAKCVAIR